MEDPLVPTETSPLVKNGMRVTVVLCFGLMLAAGALGIVNGLEPEKEATLVIGIATLILAGTSGMLMKWVADGTFEEDKMTRVILGQLIIMLVLSSSLLAVFYGPSAPDEYALGGFVQGLDPKGGPVMFEMDYGTGKTTASAGGSGVGCAPFMFPVTIPAGVTPKITIKQQPQNAFCNPPHAGAMKADKNDMKITCEEAYGISGSISGLTGKGMALSLNGRDVLPTSPGAKGFQFPQGVRTPFTYDVEVMAQPKDPDQKCTLENNKGTASKAVSDIKVTCVDS